VAFIVAIMFSLEDSLLLIGEPGAEKSAVVSSAARELRRQQALSDTSSI
jgi:MoxR-like ATPase